MARKKKSIDYSKIKYKEHWARLILTLFLHPLDGYYFDHRKNGDVNLIKVDRKWFGRWLGFNTLSTLARITHMEEKVPVLGWLFGYRTVIAQTASDTIFVLKYIRRSDVFSFVEFGEEDNEDEINEVSEDRSMEDVIISPYIQSDTPPTQDLSTPDGKERGLAVPEKDDIEKWLDENF